MVEPLRVSAPANLLLMGEYAVLEEGGLGLCVAPDVRAAGTATPGPHSGAADTDLPRTGGVVGLMPGGAVKWPGDTGLLGRVAEHLEEALGGRDRIGTLTVDTRAFFDRNGRKQGYGSSAALAVVLTALWMLRAGNLPATVSASARGGAGATAEARDAVFARAVAAHRAGQGGAGSGYDVACSTCGGVVLFTGGATPAARRIDLPWLPALSLFPGRQAVATVSAVTRLREWSAAHPHEWREFLLASNRLVEAFVGAGSWPDAARVLQEYGTLTARLGADIGVPAEMQPPQGLPEGAPFKAVGAGNELGVAFLADREAVGRGTAAVGRGTAAVGRGTAATVAIAEEGVTWAEGAT